MWTRYLCGQQTKKQRTTKNKQKNKQESNEMQTITGYENQNVMTTISMCKNYFFHGRRCPVSVISTSIVAIKH